MLLWNTLSLNRMRLTLFVIVKKTKNVKRIRLFPVHIEVS